MSYVLVCVFCGAWCTPGAASALGYKYVRCGA